MAVDGKVSLIPAPAAAPGHCAGCGKATDKLGFIDTDLQFEFFGAVIFCSDCTFEMASKYGFIKPEVAEMYRAKINELDIELAKQRAAILGLEETVDGLLKVRDSGISSIVPSTKSSDIVEPETPQIITQPESEEVGESIFEGSGGGFTDGNTEANDLIGEPVAVGVSSDSIPDLPELNF